MENGFSMGSVCAPEPAAPSVPFSSIFSTALCTACKIRSDVSVTRLLGSPERERPQPRLPSTAVTRLVPAVPGLLALLRSLQKDMDREMQLEGNSEAREVSAAAKRQGYFANLL